MATFQLDAKVKIPAVLLLLLGCLSCAANGGSKVEISPLAETYGRGDPATLLLTNVGSESVRAYANLEVVDETGEWVTWPFRIEDGKPGAVAGIYPLEPGARKGIVFDITQVSLPPIPSGQAANPAESLTFRFRVVVLQALEDQRIAEEFSETFTVAHPYGRVGR